MKQHLADEPIGGRPGIDNPIMSNGLAAESLRVAAMLAGQPDSVEWFSLIGELLHPHYRFDVDTFNPEDIRRYLRLGMAFERLSKREIGK